jgi:hypothetical protein
MRLTPLRLAHLEYDFEPPRARHYDPQCLRGTKCHMPVVAIAAAIGTFAAGAGIAFAATATLGAMVVGGAMMIGAAMVIVGTVTDRPNLVKWGGILSLAGGVGALGLGMVGGLTSGLDAIQAGENVGTAAGGVTTDSGVTALSPGDADQALANGTVQSGTATPGGGILNAGDADQALTNQSVQVNAEQPSGVTPASAPAASGPAPLSPERVRNSHRRRPTPSPRTSPTPSTPHPPRRAAGTSIQWGDGSRRTRNSRKPSSRVAQDCSRPRFRPRSTSRRSRPSRAHAPLAWTPIQVGGVKEGAADGRPETEAAVRSQTEKVAAVADQAGQNAGPVDIAAILAKVKIEPQFKKMYDMAVLSGMRFMFDKSTHQNALKYLDQPGPMAEKLAKGIVGVMYFIWEQSNKTLPPQIIVPVTFTLTLHAFDFLQKSDDPEATRDVLGDAVEKAIAGIMGKFGVAPDQIQQIIEQQRAKVGAAAGKPAAPAAPRAAARPPQGVDHERMG